MRAVAVLAALAAAPFTSPLAAQQNFDTVRVRAVRAGEGVYMLTGAGRNIGVPTGADGVVLVDDQYAPLTDRIKAAIAAIGPGPIRFLVNTHWHGDHTGGNENLGKGGVVIVAHENVRRRMSVEQFVAAFNQRFPPYLLIDLSSGGSVDGMIAAADRVLGLADADTRIIPGHGPPADRTALQVDRTMLATVRDRIREGVRAGRTLEQVQAAKPTAEFDAVWGRGSFSPVRFVDILYRDLSR